MVAHDIRCIVVRTEQKGVCVGDQQMFCFESLLPDPFQGKRRALANELDAGSLARKVYIKDVDGSAKMMLHERDVGWNVGKLTSAVHSLLPSSRPIAERKMTT